MASSKQIRVVVDAIRDEVGRERNALALEIVDQLVQRPPVGTPVATGWARANWLPSINAPARGVSARGKRGPTNGDVKRAEATQQAAIANLITAGAGDPMAPAWVSNHVPYIGRLGDGWSAQQAAGWIDRCVATAVDLRGQAQTFSPIRRV